MVSIRMFAVIFGILLPILLFSHRSLAQGEFYKCPDNPVMSNQSGWEAYNVQAPHVLREGGTYFMWYAGGGYYNDLTTGIGYATSFDGETWQKYSNNPILTRGPIGSWDENYISSPSILRIGTIYYMLYAGTNSSIWQIGLAWSPDRVTWYKYPGNPVFTQGKFGDWDGQGVRDPMVVFDGTEFKMYYTGYDGAETRIGMATSPDGLTWTRAPNNPIITEGSGWDGLGVATPFVYFDDITYSMWYAGYGGYYQGCPDYTIGLATSTDGCQWEKADGVNPVLEQGAVGFDRHAVFHPSVVPVRDLFQMWYTGREYILFDEEEETRIGLARPTPLWLDVTPSTNEIPIGDYLDLEVSVRNTSSDEIVEFQLWSNVTLPTGSNYSGNPVLGPEDLLVGPHQAYTGYFSLYVPEQAPQNSGYRLITGIGNHPNDIWDFSWFEFEILPLP